MRNKALLFDVAGERSFGHSTCFLCGSTLGGSNRSAEHVIPRWAQDRFKLWDQRLTLANRTTIPYRQLTIPCCSICNNRHLAPIEREVACAVRIGAEAVSQLDSDLLFLWLGKIFFGLLYKEILIPFDRSDPAQGPIASPEELEQFKLHHVFLQGARVPLRFEGGFPASIFVFDLQTLDDVRQQFDFRDGIFTLTLAIRLGRVGIISSLQDAGAQAEQYSDYMTQFQQFALHPLQFAELTAKVFYKASLFNRVPKYLMLEKDNEVIAVQSPIAGFSTEPLFDDWDFERYAKFLSLITGIPIDTIYEPPEMTMSWLTDQRDDPTFLDLRKFPYPIAP